MNRTRERWASRTSFILAAIGSAVGLGNAWRFPGLAAKHGGGAFLFAYFVLLLAVGAPILMAEVAVGRRTRHGAAGAMRGIHPRAEGIGWAETANAFIVSVYYAVIFAWVILMTVFSYRFAAMTGDGEAAAGVFQSITRSTGTTAGFTPISVPVLIALLAAWILIYCSIRNGTNSMGKVVKVTVFFPVVALAILAVRSLFLPGAWAGVKAFFIPDFRAFLDLGLWIDAVGQVFYSLSVMMAVMFAYGSLLDDGANVAADALIITVSDFAVSLLAGVVLFSTLYGTGMTAADLTGSGVRTAFLVYPTAIVHLSGSGVLNALFAALFYLSLCTLAIDSAFSMVEGVAVSLSDRFLWDKRRTTFFVTLAAAVLSLLYIGGSGEALVDLTDHYLNALNLILVGFLETAAIGWFFPTRYILWEVNRNTGRAKMPRWWFLTSLKVLAPLLLLLFFGWNLRGLIRSGGIWGGESGYSLAANLLFGWSLPVLMLFACLFFPYFVRRFGRAEPSLSDRIAEDND